MSSYVDLARKISTQFANEGPDDFAREASYVYQQEQALTEKGAAQLVVDIVDDGRVNGSRPLDQIPEQTGLIFREDFRDPLVRAFGNLPAHLRVSVVQRNLGLARGEELVALLAELPRYGVASESVVPQVVRLLGDQNVRDAAMKTLAELAYDLSDVITDQLDLAFVRTEELDEQIGIALAIYRIEEDPLPLLDAFVALHRGHQGGQLTEAQLRDWKRLVPLAIQETLDNQTPELRASFLSVLVFEQFQKQQKLAAADYLAHGIEVGSLVNPDEAMRLANALLPLVLSEETDPEVALSALDLTRIARPQQAVLVPQMLVVTGRLDQPDLVVKALEYIREVGSPALKKARPGDGASTAYILGKLVKLRNSEDADKKKIGEAAAATQRALGLTPRTEVRREAVDTAVRADPASVGRTSL